MSQEAINLNFGARIGEVERANKKLMSDNDKLIKKLQKLTGESKKAGKAAAKTGKDGAAGIRGMAVAATGAGVALLTVNKLLAVGKKEIDHILQQQDRAKTASLSLAKNEAEFLINLGPKTVKGRDSALTEITAMSRRTGVAEADLFTRASSAVSAKGPLGRDRAFNAVEASAELLPHDPAAGTVLAGAALDIMKIQAGRGEDVTAEQSIGYIQAVGQNARITSPEHLAGSVAPAVAAGMAHEQTSVEAGALFAAFTGSMVDTTGKKAGTAQEQYTRQLDDFYPDLPTYAARLTKIQGDPAEQQKFMGESSFEGKALVGINELISGKGSMADAVKAFEDSIPSFVKAGEQFEKSVTLNSSTPRQLTAGFDRAMGAGVERLEGGNQGDVLESIIRDRLRGTLGATGSSDMQIKFEQIGGFVSADSLGRFGDVLGEKEGRLREVHKPLTNAQYGVGGGSGYAFEPDAHIPTREELRQADELGVLRREVENMAAIRQAQEANTLALEANSKAVGRLADQTDANGRQNTKPAPADAQTQRLIGAE